MSTKALNLYWSHFKSFAQSNWKYAFAFTIGSFLSAISTFLFAKRLSGLDTFGLIFKIMMLREETQYRNTLRYDGFSSHPTPLRPSTAMIAADSIFRRMMKPSAEHKKWTMQAYEAKISGLRQQYLKPRHLRYLLPAYVDTPQEVVIKETSVNDQGPLKGVILTYPGASTSNGVILHIHGGGFSYGFPEEGTPMLCVMAQYTGMVAFSVDYHYVPEISVPQQVDECVEAYKYILNTMKVDSNKVFVTGGSAGGTLTLLLIQKLKKLNLPQPLGAIPISAMTDISCATAIKARDEDGINDALLQNLKVEFGAIDLDNIDRPKFDAATTDVERAAVLQTEKYSPLFGDFKGLCPLYISTTEQEAFSRENKLMIEKCKDAGLDFEVDIDPYLPHATLYFVSMIPEARDKLIIVTQWMKKLLH